MPSLSRPASARPALASPGPSRSAPVHCGGPQRITSLLVQTSTSQLNLVINYKHHRIGSSLPSPNISRAAPRSYAHQSHVYAQNHHTMTRATGLYKYRTPAPTTWRCPRSQIRTRTRRPTLTKAPNPTTHSLLIHNPSTITGHQPRPRGDARGAKYGPEHGVLRSPKHPIRPHILY